MERRACHESESIFLSWIEYRRAAENCGIKRENPVVLQGESETLKVSEKTSYETLEKKRWKKACKRRVQRKERGNRETVYGAFEFEDEQCVGL